jgi:hypothetical protein
LIHMPSCFSSITCIAIEETSTSFSGNGEQNQPQHLILLRLLY